MRLSFCAIVKDEAERLSRCLGSVASVVDEMVVLDTGSTDGTIAIAREWGARVYEAAWENDFAAARNQSLKHAEGDWILVLDADEVLVSAVGAQLQQTIANEQQVLINLVRQEVGAAQSPYSLVSRLFRNRPEIYFSRPYHAMVDDSVAALLRREPQWQIGSLSEVAILHEGYGADAIATRNKLARARAAMEQFLANHPNDPYVCSKLGALYVDSGNLQQGIDLLQRGLVVPKTEASILYELHYHLGIACSRLNQAETAIAHYEKATQQPILPRLKLGAYNNLGNLRKAKGNLTAARAAYETMLQVEPEFAPAHYNLGMTLKAMGDLAGAIAAYRQALNLQPDYAEAHQNLGIALLKCGQIPESLTALRRAIHLHEHTNPPEAKRLRQGLKELGFSL